MLICIDKVDHSIGFPDQLHQRKIGMFWYPAIMPHYQTFCSLKSDVQ